MGISSGGHYSIDERCYAYDEVDLGLTWGVNNLKVLRLVFCLFLKFR